MSEPREEMRVGEKIKRLREDRALSLEEISRKTGLSPSVLSQLENHLISPPLGTLIKIAQAFEVPVGYFFREGPEQDPFCLVREHERQKVSRFASKDGVNYGYSYESLGYGKKGRHLEPFVVTLTPATYGQADLSSHAGEEFIYVLEGEVEVTLSDHTDLLHPNDSIYYDATLPHRVACAQDRPAKIVAVIWTPES
jgi:transcriptional regulator with XRE-family HTH domain